MCFFVLFNVRSFVLIVDGKNGDRESRSFWFALFFVCCDVVLFRPVLKPQLHTYDRRLHIRNSLRTPNGNSYSVSHTVFHGSQQFWSWTLLVATVLFGACSSNRLNNYGVFSLSFFFFFSFSVWKTHTYTDDLFLFPEKNQQKFRNSQKKESDWVDDFCPFKGIEFRFVP